MSDDLVAAQGLTVPDGLAGGIWLLRDSPGKPSFPEQVSSGGDSPRLANGYVVWQELKEVLEVRMKPISGGKVSTISAGDQPAADGTLLAWIDPSGSLLTKDFLSSSPPVHIASQAFGPDVLGDRIACLARSGDSYSLLVYNWANQAMEWTLEHVDFPTGRGPVLTDTSVIWEAGQRLGMGHLREYIF